MAAITARARVSRAASAAADSRLNIGSEILKTFSRLSIDRQRRWLRLLSGIITRGGRGRHAFSSEGASMNYVRKILGPFDPLLTCPHLELIYTTKFTQNTLPLHLFYDPLWGLFNHVVESPRNHRGVTLAPLNRISPHPSNFTSPRQSEPAME